MYKILRIICCIIAVMFAAAAIFVLALVDWKWGLSVVGGAIVFGALTVLFKQLQEKKERLENPPPPKGDFITGKIGQPQDKKEED